MNPPTKNKLYTDYYREQGEKLHEDRPSFGRGPRLRLHRIMEFVHHEKVTEMIDYGCGKAMLETFLRCKVYNYDPMMPRYSADPEATRLPCIGRCTRTYRTGISRKRIAPHQQQIQEESITLHFVGCR